MSRRGRIWRAARLRIIFATAGLVIGWIELFWRHCTLACERSPGGSDRRAGIRGAQCGPVKPAADGGTPPRYCPPRRPVIYPPDDAYVCPAGCPNRRPGIVFPAPLGPADKHIDIPASLPRADQLLAPIEHRGVGAMLPGHLGGVELDRERQQASSPTSGIYVLFLHRRLDFNRSAYVSLLQG